MQGNKVKPIKNSRVEKGKMRKKKYWAKTARRSPSVRSKGRPPTSGIFVLSVP